MLQLPALRLFLPNPRTEGALLDLPPRSQITFCLLSQQQGVLLPSAPVVFLFFFLSFFPQTLGACQSRSLSSGVITFLIARKPAVIRRQQRHFAGSKLEAKVKPWKHSKKGNRVSAAATWPRAVVMQTRKVSKHAMWTQKREEVSLSFVQDGLPSDDKRHRDKGGWFQGLPIIY